MDFLAWFFEIADLFYCSFLNLGNVLMMTCREFVNVDYLYVTSPFTHEVYSFMGGSGLNSTIFLPIFDALPLFDLDMRILTLLIFIVMGNILIMAFIRFIKVWLVALKS